MFRTFMLIVFLLLPLGACRAQDANPHVNAPDAVVTDLGKDRPVIAIWHQWLGLGNTENISLRAAIWSDGRVLIAKDPRKWGSDLLQGRISATNVRIVKKQIAATGVFARKLEILTLPDEPQTCMVIDLGKKHISLIGENWPDEPIGPKNMPAGVDYAALTNLKLCWISINNIALDARPEHAVPVKSVFSQVPQSWYLERFSRSGGAQGLN